MGLIAMPENDALESFLIAGWQMMRPVSHMDWLIWSSDHGGWSKPNRHGYTNRLADAGRYSFDEALEIVQDANSGTLARNFPSETMCPDWTEETPGAPSGS
jgi:hypothetical protein